MGTMQVVLMGGHLSSWMHNPGWGHHTRMHHSLLHHARLHYTLLHNRLHQTQLHRLYCLAGTRSHLGIRVRKNNRDAWDTCMAGISGAGRCGTTIGTNVAAPPELQSETRNSKIRPA